MTGLRQQPHPIFWELTVDANLAHGPDDILSAVEYVLVDDGPVRKEFLA